MESALRQPASKPLPLQPGQRLSQEEFHRRYEACPNGVKFELVGGIVYMASPLRRRHGKRHIHLGGVFFQYELATPGVEVLDNATAILGEQSEPQPDLALRILTEWGGQSQVNASDYIVGGAELLSEVSDSTKTIDLKQKKQDYRKAGVLEYLVACLKEQELHWFNFRTRKRLPPDSRGIYRSQVFPGLWVHAPALFAGDSKQLVQTVQEGLASKEHAAFVKTLKERWKRRER